MRSPQFTRMVQVRMAPHLVEAVQAKAAREGMTVAELMRHALRRELADAA